MDDDDTHNMLTITQSAPCGYYFHVSAVLCYIFLPIVNAFNVVVVFIIIVITLYHVMQTVDTDLSIGVLHLFRFILEHA